MANVERIREVLSRPFDEGYLRARLNDGWRLVAVHWERDVEGGPPEPARWTEEVPYGLRVAADCIHLEEDPAERCALELMLKLLSSDKPMSQIARELNDHNLRTRSGNPWTQTAVFNMLPRLIEAAPQLWKKEGQSSWPG
jgi:hypothetical protein